MADTTGNTSTIKPFRFGIPSLDLLLGKVDNEKTAKKLGDTGNDINQFGVKLRDFSHSTSLSLIGPDGTGKSILAMHLASRYKADNPLARVLYVSTDLTYDKADQMWTSFGLDHAASREIPFAKDLMDDVDGGSWRYGGDNSTIRPTRYVPESTGAGDAATIDAYLLKQPCELKPCEQHEIAFIDLAARTAGDDWGFLCRILASLDRPADKHPRDLLLVDAVEGFEMFDGDTDAFGQRLTRRARISQIMRLTAGKCHAVFIVEEAHAGERLPEEFVTDSVLRLRTSKVRDYVRRTVEIDKVRGQSHMRGEHTYAIRKGTGSNTMGQGHYDDPRVMLGEQYQSYVVAFPSLHSQSREYMQRPPIPEATDKPDYAGFGIHRLDEMLVEHKGFEFGSVAALIGDHHTYKRELGFAFLAGEIDPLCQAAATVDSGTLEDLEAAFRSSPEFTKRGGAVLITQAQGISNATLAATIVKWYFARHHPAPSAVVQQALIEVLKDKITCRRLEVHDLPSSVFLHVIDRAIRGTRERMQEKGGTNKKVRVVIDDLGAFKEIYPDVRQDSLFLAGLLFRLRHPYVAALIVHSSPGSPDSLVDDPFDSELRTLVDYRLYTWRVPFFGESRIAIAPMPPLARLERDAPSAIVRELRWINQEERPYVDTRFEMYSGLESGAPEPVRLQVRLFGAAPNVAQYLGAENAIWRQLFSPVTGTDVLVCIPGENYDLLHSYMTLQRETRLDFTLVLQVDEFWFFPSGSVLSRKKYLCDEVIYKKDEVIEGQKFVPEGQTDFMVDPFQAFRPAVEPGPSDSQHLDQKKCFNRSEGFDATGYHIRNEDHTPEQHGPFENDFDRVPFIWDFGFLACRKKIWEAGANLTIKWWTETQQPRFEAVADIWNAMPKAYAAESELAGSAARHEKSPGRRPSWREFLGACTTVAHSQGDAVAFSFSGPADAESFSCLLLEIWMSELSLSDGAADTLNDFTMQKWLGNWKDSHQTLSNLVEKHGFELYKSWLLISASIDLARIVNPDSPFEYRASSEDQRSVATRHWYQTASRSENLTDDIVFAGLPGNWSIRGDWFLAVASNSRSALLGDRACDLLSTVRANFERMQLGIGLPTRDIVNNVDRHRIRTALRATTKTNIPGRESGNVRYGDLLRLGSHEESDNFNWLWRSRIRNYNLHSRLWLKWLNRLAIAWSERKILVNPDSKPWVGGFRLYDKLTKSRASETWNDPIAKEQYEDSWHNFNELCQVFINLVKKAGG